jgi:seryl-tRNA synthetase
MLDLKKVREHQEHYQADLNKRGSNIDVDMILQLDDERKVLQQQIDTLKFQQKELAAKQDYEGAKALKADIQTMETDHTQITAKLKDLQLQMPNFISPAVPVGKDETENVEIRKV